MPASSLNPTVGDTSGTIAFLKHILSTITSSAFSEVVVIYGDHDFNGVGAWSSDKPPFHQELSRTERVGEITWDHWKFEMWHEVYTVRVFQLVLCASIWGCVGEYPVRMLEEAVAEGKVKGVFGTRFPSVMYSPRRTYEIY